MSVIIFRSFAVVLISTMAGIGVGRASEADELRSKEAIIAEIHRAIMAGEVTAGQVVQQSLRRIESFDKSGPTINAIITINPNALWRASELDAVFARVGPVGALHGIPVVVKDNYDTADKPTSAGSLSLKHSVPPDDAFQVRRLREAGAKQATQLRLAPATTTLLD